MKAQYPFCRSGFVTFDKEINGKKRKLFKFT